MDLWLLLLLQLAALVYALLGGIFLAFSDFLLRSINQAPAGVAVMQAINRDVFRSLFLALFFVMIPASLVLGLFGLLAVSGGAALCLLIAGLVYVIGVFAVTGFGNVPLNKALAALPDGSEEAQAYWQATYRRRWAAWNHLRTAACFLSAGLVSLAVVLLGTP
ncbi:MAG: anthrone oxygenase family protein [Pseudomonadota bacterium]